MCTCYIDASEVVCDGINDNETENVDLPTISILPSVNTYVFKNFKQIRGHILGNATFRSNQPISIIMINISVINSHAFTGKQLIPEDSPLFIEIVESHVVLMPNAFHHLKIGRLRFADISTFNGTTIFDSGCFGDELQINELVFERTGLTEFRGSETSSVAVDTFQIQQCPSFTTLSPNNLPKFLRQTARFEITETGLNSIYPNTFEMWKITFQEFVLRNNTNLTSFQSNIFTSLVSRLNKLDLSYNPITVLDTNFNWDDYSFTKKLALEQQKIDLYLRSNIFKYLKYLQVVNFSHGFIGDEQENQNLIRDYVFPLPNLLSIDLSYTNLTELMIIDWLKILSESANRTMRIRLHGRTLSENNFCSYYRIFQQAPKLLRLELDDEHPCNCIVDLFYRYGNPDTSQFLLQPSCLMDNNRTVCNISNKFNTQCSTGHSSADESNTNIGPLGRYAFIGIVVGLGMAVLVIVGIGSGAVYRRNQQRPRFSTVVDMEEPIENPEDAIIAELSETLS